MSESNSVFFSDDDEGFAGLNEEVAFQANFDKAFEAHAKAALQADPRNSLLQETIQISLLLGVTE